MPDFTYQGVERTGKKVSGKMNVATEGDLRMTLRAQGIRPIKITKASVLNTDLSSLLGGGSRVTLDGLVVFTRQLQVLIGAGVPIVQALDVLQDQTVEKSLKVIIGHIRERVSGGAYFWESLAAYPKAFPKIFVSLIRAGESSGSIDQMLKRLSRYMEDSNRIRKTLKSASIYPTVVLTLGFLITIGLLVFVVPKFAEMLTAQKQEIPAITQFVMNLSDAIVHNFLIFAGVIGATVFLGLRYFRSTEGRAFMHRVLFKAPVIGNIMQKAGVARFTRTMHTLLSSGVNLLDAIEICRGAVDNVVLEEAISTIKGEVEGGKSLGLVVSKLEVFPKMAAQMISIGESTGSLDKMLEKIADFYEEEVETLIAGLTKLMEPVLLVLLGGMIGSLILAIYLPIFKSVGAQM